ncbi:MAG: gliding motility-associated C-terminal domain-containing protein, partial [Marinoscillum sp.]
DNNCGTANPNGTITIDDIFVDGASADLTTNGADYSFAWTGLNAGASVNNVLATGDQVTDVAPGTYTVIVTKQSTNECSSASASVTVGEDVTTPIVQIVTKTSDTYCDNTDNVGDGSLTVDIFHPSQVDAPLDNSIYTVSWYRGTHSTAPGVGDNDFLFDNQGATQGTSTLLGDASANADFTELSGLKDGTYTVFVSKNGAGATEPNLNCSVVSTFNITNKEPVISIQSADFVITNNFNCSPFDGSIRIDTIREGSTIYAMSTNSGNYTFTWTGPNSYAGSGRSITGLEAGVYTLNISNVTTGCPSTATDYEFTVIDESKQPVAIVDAITDNTYCTASNEGDGSLTIEIRANDTTSTAASAADYTIEWYRGTSAGTVGDANFIGDNATATAAGSNAGSAYIVGGNILELDSLSEGSYTVRITKNSSPYQACERIRTFAIETNEPTYTLDEATDVDSDDNYNCSSPNGYIEITGIQVDGDDSVYPIGDYTFTWEKNGIAFVDGTDGTITDGLAGGTGNRIENLEGGTYSVVANHTTTGCITEVDLDIEIEDSPVNPVIVFVSKSPSTFCDTSGNSGDGSLEVAINEAGVAATMTDYTLTWYRGTNTTPANEIFPTDGGTQGTATANADFTALSTLQDGLYTLVAMKNDGTNPNGGCSVTRTFEILEDINLPIVNVPNTQITHNTTCVVSGNGQIIVNASNIKIDGVTQSDLSLFDWTITSTNGSDIDGNPSPYTPAYAASTARDTLFNLPPDTYTFTLTVNSTGCAGSSFAITILDESIDPNIEELTMVPNANCSGTVALGSVEITSIDGAANFANYTYQWYVGSAATAGQEVNTILGETDDTNIIQNLPHDFYTVVITNISTTCTTTQTIEVENAPVYPIIGQRSITHDISCFTPGFGSFSINTVRYQGDTLFMNDPTDAATIASDFTAIFYESDRTTVITDLDPSTPLQLDSLKAGTYFASITVNDSQCGSNLVQFDIQDNPFVPELFIRQLQADSTCSPTGTTPTGILTVVADSSYNQAHIDSTYTFNWYQVDNVGTRISASLSTNDTLTNQYQGIFEVEVRNQNVGCIDNAFYSLRNVPQKPRILAVDSANQITCSPSDAYFEVTQVNLGSLSDYTFHFYNEDPTVGNPTPIYSGPSAVLSFAATGFDVVPGDYYVNATNNNTSCDTDIFQVTIEDKTTPPSIDFEEKEPLTYCSPEFADGQFSVSVDGSTDTTRYTFEWTDENGNVIEANNSTVDSLYVGVYTVTVTDNTTGCSSSDSYTMEEEPTLNVSITSQPNEGCIEQFYNGELSVNINNYPGNRGSSDYNFYWFVGDLTGQTIDVADNDTINSHYINLYHGDYTLYIVNKVDSSCTYGPFLAKVRRADTKIDFRVDIVNDVTNCYPTLPNGRAAIGFIEKDISGYRFDWYLGSVDAETTDIPIRTGNSADSLALGDYTVIATDLNTGCKDTYEFNMSDEELVFPSIPSVTILKHRTNCGDPNGRAIARVNGESDGYLFEWFEENSDVVLFTGSEVNMLDSISYHVKATNIATGCESIPQTVTILGQIVDPVFEIKKTTSICLRSEDGSTNLFNGTADILFEENNQLQEVTWTSPGGLDISDLKLVNAEPGEWMVRFTAENGCEYSTTFVIDASLKVYNGISANGDGKNDFMIIDCIDYFPNNHMTVYNRDGTLVYEADGYNNLDVRFDGTGNVGRTGLKLPIGTYFYFIDKGDGSPVINGYLELVR